MTLTLIDFSRSVHDFAPELIGATLLVDGVGGRSSRSRPTTGTILRATAPRPTERNASMFGPRGHA